MLIQVNVMETKARLMLSWNQRRLKNGLQPEPELEPKPSLVHMNIQDMYTTKKEWIQ